MPTYEYHCPKCKLSYELRQGFDAETTHPCEECGKGIAKRILHAPRVVFKGSGWYANDSRKSQPAVSESSESSGESSASEAGDAGDAPAKEPSTPTESKPKEPKPKQSAAKSSASKESGNSTESAAAG